MRILNRFVDLFTDRKKIIRSHIRNLIELAMVDGKFDEAENQLLIKIGKQYGITESKIMHIRMYLDEIKFKEPKEHVERFNLLYDLVLMMTIDNNIDHEEQVLCWILASKFGYPPHQIPQLIEIICQNIKYGLGYHESWKRVSLFLLEQSKPAIGS